MTDQRSPKGDNLLKQIDERIDTAMRYEGTIYDEFAIDELKALRALRVAILQLQEHTSLEAAQAAEKLIQKELVGQESSQKVAGQASSEEEE